MMIDMVCYLRSSDIYEETLEEIRQDLLYMFLDTQEKGEDIHKRIQPDLEAFCDEIIEHAPKKTKRYKTIENIDIFFVELFILTLIMTLFSLDFTFISNTHSLPSTLSISSLTLLLFISFLFLAPLLYSYISKTAFQTSQPSTKQTKIKHACILCLCTILIACLLMLSPFVPKISIPMNFIFILLFLSICISIGCQLYTSHSHQ